MANVDCGRKVWLRCAIDQDKAVAYTAAYLATRGLKQASGVRRDIKIKDIKVFKVFGWLAIKPAQFCSFLWESIADAFETIFFSSSVGHKHTAGNRRQMR
jgi:hypothetical protein